MKKNNELNLKKTHDFDRHGYQQKRTALRPGFWFGSVEKQHGESCEVAEI